LHVHVELHNPGDVSPGFFVFYEPSMPVLAARRSTGNGHEPFNPDELTARVPQQRRKRCRGKTLNETEQRFFKPSVAGSNPAGFGNEAGYRHQVTAQVGGVTNYETSRA